jgi:hypothetical protein
LELQDAFLHVVGVLDVLGWKGCQSCTVGVQGGSTYIRRGSTSFSCMFIVIPAIVDLMPETGKSK